MNRNSQYVNQVNVHIGEMVRLTFNEVMPQHNNEIEPVATFSMHLEFLKVLNKTISGALSEHEANIANVAKGMN